MSVQNGFRRASFRGVNFLLPSDSSLETTFGSKTATHEFINSDRPLVEFLGQSGETFRLTIIINSNAFPFYNRQKKALEEALSKQEAGVLIHPTEGRKVVSVVDLPRKTENLSEINTITYSVVFKETTSKKYPTGEGNKSFLLKKIDEAKEAIGDFYENNFDSSSPRFSENFSKAKEFVTSGLNNINDAVALINTGGDVLSEYTRNYNQALNDINTLVSTPASFVERIQGLWGSVLTVTGNTADAFGVNLGIIDDSSPETVGNSTVYTQIRLNEKAIKDFNNVNGLINTYNLITDIDFQSQNDLDEAFNELESKYQDIIDDLDSDVAYSIKEVRNQTRLLLDSLRGNLARTITIYTSPTNATELAYRYYGDISRSNEIIEINNITNADYIEGEINILEF